MKAVHIRTEGMRDEHESAFVEMVVRLIDGVKDVASIRTLHLISVLYDERVANLSQILESVRRAGFRAYPYQPERSTRSLRGIAASL